MSHEFYENPLIRRYASPEMSRLWGGQKKFRTWRQLWVWLAESEAELGLSISPAQIDELRRNIDNIDFVAAEKHERRLRHDVMAHVHTYGDQCPQARGIIHLGATSCFVTDNADLMFMRDGLKDPCQPARNSHRSARRNSPNSTAICHAWVSRICNRRSRQPSANELAFGQPISALDLREMEHRLAELKARGVKGATGTQASFLELFGGDRPQSHTKVQQLEQLVAQKMGFSAVYPVTGQTYSRKIDSQVLAALSGVAQSAHKAATDLRILASRKELEEPFRSGSNRLIGHGLQA